MTAQPDSTREAATGEPAAVRVRYFAGARAAAGVAEETVRVTPASPDAPVRAGDVLDAVLAAHGERLARVVAACSFLLNGVSARDRGTPVRDGDELDVLPPFAGG